MTQVFSSRPIAFQRVHDLADGPIDLLDDVAVEAALGFAAKFITHMQRHVRHVVGEVEEERAVFVVLDELDGVFRVPGGELVLIFVADVGDDDLVAFDTSRRSG